MGIWSVGQQKLGIGSWVFEHWRNLLERVCGSLFVVRVAKETYCTMADLLLLSHSCFCGTLQGSYASSTLLGSASSISFPLCRFLFLAFSSANIRDIHVFHLSSESKNPGDFFKCHLMS